MSRKKVVALCFGYYAAPVAFQLYLVLRQPFGFDDVKMPAVIGGMLGAAFSA
jgi:hypothetical protein